MTPDSGNKTVTAGVPGTSAESAHAALCTALDRLHQAITANDLRARGQQADRAMALISALRATLDHSEGRAVTERLDALYAYCSRRLLSVSLGETRALSEIATLIASLQDTCRAVAPAQPPAATDPAAAEAARPPKR